jgi:N-acetylglucosaminyl-diphospho-decaprenol L-rhamnosyltransferase
VPKQQLLGAKITIQASPTVSVLIVNYNSGLHLRNAVGAVAAQTMRDLQAIVVDNCSTDASLGLAQAAVREDERFCFVANQRNVGFAAGNNFAAAMARGAWLALLNPDAVPAPDWLEQLLAATRRYPAVVMFGSTQIDAVDPQRLDGAGDHYLASGLPWRGGHGWPAKELPKEGEVFAPCAAACLIRADAFRGANGFDDRFFCYVEDVDLAFRLRLLGHSCVQVPAAVVRHAGAASASREGPAFADQFGTRNLIWCFVKCMPGPLFWPLLPIHILTVLLWAARIGKPAWDGIRTGLGGMSVMWASRLTLQRTRRAPWWRIAFALSWDPIAYLRRAP